MILASSRSLALVSLLCALAPLPACGGDEDEIPTPTSTAGAGGATGGAGAGASGASGQAGGPTSGNGGQGGAGEAGAGAGGAGQGGAGGESGAGAGGEAGAGAGGAGAGGAGAGGAGAGGATGGGSGTAGMSGTSGSSGTAGAGGGAAKKFCDLPAKNETELSVPAGFCLRKFATLKVPRVIRVAPNGDVFVTDPATFTPGGASDGLGAIAVLPDDNHDGTADEVITYSGSQTSTASTTCAEHEKNPADLYCVHGLAFSEGHLYFTRSDEVRRFPYKPGDRKAPVDAGELVATLGGAAFPDTRWTHTLDRSTDGTMFVSRGRQESSNCTAESMAQGAVLRLDVSTGVTLPTTATVSSDGYRNPMYLRCNFDDPTCFASELSGDSWSGIGGREKLVVLKDGDKWGYPCCVGKGMPAKGTTPASVCASISEELKSIKLHDTPFGMDFERGSFPSAYSHALFFALHGSFGSWEGTNVSYLPYDPATKLPTGELVPFVTGWGTKPGDFTGRATDLAFSPDGRLFIIDDTSGGVWWMAPVDLEVPADWQ